MKVLCIGGHNDGEMVGIDEYKRAGDTVSLTYKEKLEAPRINDDGDELLTYCTEKYTVRNIYFTPGGRVTVLVIDGREEIPQILQDLVDGYRKPKEQTA